MPSSGSKSGSIIAVAFEGLPATGFKAGLSRVWRAFRDGFKDTLEKQGALIVFCSLRSCQHHFSLASGENVRRHHNSSIPLSIFADGAKLGGGFGAFFVACDLLAMRHALLSRGELRRENVHAQASGEGVEISRGH